MPVVQVEGVFMGASIVTKEFDGNKRTSLSIDLYQKNESGNETVKLSSKAVELFQTISENYKLGTPFKCKATVSAYKNNAYYNLLEVVK